MFFGSGAFGVPILEATASAPDIALVAVVSGPDRPAGRGLRTDPTPVAARAAALGLPVLRPASLRDPATLAAIADLAPDLGILADYGRIVPPAILALPRLGILNVHPSILPRHRGATPIPATIAAGDAEAGVSIIAMDAGIDSGPIVAQDRWPLGPTVDAPGLEAEAARRGADLLRTILPGWLTGERRAVAQPVDGVTVSRVFRREDGRLDPDRSAAELERRVRALRPWPGSFVETSIGRLAVLEADVGPSVPDVGPGILVADGDGLALTTGDGRLRLTRVVPAGGRPMSGTEFRRGRGRPLIGRPVERGAADIVGESARERQHAR